MISSQKDIIPQALLDQFLSMVEPSRAQAIENDIARHCAFNFPAVAFTVGRQHWALMKPAYVALSNDMQVATVGFSILTSSLHLPCLVRKFL